jgi:hypothetical protein
MTAQASLYLLSQLLQCISIDRLAEHCQLQIKVHWVALQCSMTSWQNVSCVVNVGVHDLVTYIAICCRAHHPWLR